MPTHIIAEAGSNYNGSVDLAKRLNLAAAEAGADSVKYQVINTDRLYLPGDYPYGKYRIEDVRQIRRRDELPATGWAEIRDHAVGIGIAFSASVFDEEGLALLDSFDPPYLKIASCDLNNHRLLRQVAAVGRRMVVSTGMSDLWEVEAAVKVLAESGIHGENLVLLHCVSAYPSTLRDSNLSIIGILKKEFGTAVGFSDHTMGTEAACVAVALGATWLEKHFTVDRSLEGLDHKHAAEPDELGAYVEAVRGTEASMSPRPVKIGEAEALTRQRARRSLYAARDLGVSEVVSDADVLVVRPEGPLSASDIDLLVGKRMTRAVRAFEPFLPRDLA